MVELPNEARDDLIKFQQLQQQVQALMLQKQNVQIQLAEVENALKEVDKVVDTEIYEIIGSVMIKRQKATLMDSLREKKEVLNLRISTLEKQIDKLNEKLKELHQKVLSYTQKEKKKK